MQNTLCDLTPHSSSDDLFKSACDLDDSISEAIGSHKHNFNVCHINAQSIPAHYTDLICTFSAPEIVDAILISETWLKPSLPSTSYSLPGYLLIRNDCTGSRGGGVAIFLRSELSYKIICSSPSQSTPVHHTDFISKSFAVVASTLWSSLPQSIREAPNRFWRTCIYPFT